MQDGRPADKQDPPAMAARLDHRLRYCRDNKLLRSFGRNLAAHEPEHLVGLTPIIGSHPYAPISDDNRVPLHDMVHRLALRSWARLTLPDYDAAVHLDRIDRKPIAGDTDRGLQV